jgi:DNA-binding HxlR family transcriptional regulator
MQPDHRDNCCPIARILKLVGAKWTAEILRETAVRPTRTRQFLAHIPGLTMKCLQERLKALESAGMIARIKYDEKVPRVEHHLTERGRRLLKIFVELKELAEETMDVNCVCPMDLRVADGVTEYDYIEFNCPDRRESLPSRRAQKDKALVEPDLQR